MLAVPDHRGLYIPPYIAMNGGMQSLSGMGEFRKLGAAGGGYSELKNTISSTCFHLDATQSASYGGSGQTWSNLTTSPADGQAQTDYDFYLGATSSATTDDPTFNGSAGSNTAYWSLDGGDSFSLKSGTNTTLIEDMSKVAGGDWWIAFVGKTSGTLASLDAICGTSNSTSQTGFRFVISSSGSGDLRFLQRNTGGSTIIDTSGTVATSTNYIGIVSHSNSSNQIRFWVNNRTKEEFSLTYTSGTGSATSRLFINAANNGSKSSNGTLTYAFAAGNAYIDNTAAGQIIDYFNNLHGRTYVA